MFSADRYILLHKSIKLLYNNILGFLYSTLLVQKLIFTFIAINLLVSK